MPASLARLLKVRRVLEESSRMELERRVALGARIQHSEEREKAVLLQSRENALAAVIEGSGSVQDSKDRRVIEWANVESAMARRQQLRAMADATETLVIEARATFLQRRRERRQLESVLDAEQAIRRTEKDRRDQRDMDDWFSLKQVRQRRTRSANNLQS